MIQTRIRRIARLEELAQAFIKPKREGNAKMREFVRKQAFVPIANLSLLVLYGMPKIDEPLLNAWDRVRKSAEWLARRRDHPDFGEYGYEDHGEFGERRREDQRDEDQELFCEYEHEDQEDFPDRIYRGKKYFDKSSGEYIATPFDRLGAMYIANYFHKYFLPDLPGADETEKLNQILETAAPWLLWFTFGDFYGRLLGLTVPDVSSMSKFSRGELPFDWLPTGPFECDPVPPGTKDKFYKPADERPEVIVLPDNLTRRERERAMRIYKSLGLSAR